MKYFLLAAVFVLMLSIGMSLRLPELVANWRRNTWDIWLRLLLATFILPPLVALILARVFPLTLQETAGLFMVAATPGAPLLTRNLAKRGFDMHLAASYQVWGALMTPIMIPLVVFAAAQLYNRTVWIPPRVLLVQIAEKQFLPLLAGVALMRFAPTISRKIQPALTMLGNAVLTLVFVLLLWKMGPALKNITPWVFVAAVLIMAASIASIHLLLRRAEPAVRRTLAVSNANRHVGLALLLSGQYMRNRNALPAVACYALVVAVLMALSPKLFKTRDQKTQSATA